jgi:hypothetical protein
MTEQIVQEVPSAEELARHFSALGDSVTLINAIVAGEWDETQDEQERKDTVQRNVDHLELMKAKQGWWTTEDFTAVDAAIASGKAYV